MIISVQEYWHCSHEEFVRRVLKQRRQLDLMPQEFIEDMYVEAVVDAGRWIVNCAFCNGAELADKSDPRFYCLSCLNEAAGHRWLRVVFPEGWEQIEAALDERPERLRFWRPPATLAELQAENLTAD